MISAFSFPLLNKSKCTKFFRFRHQILNPCMNEAHPPVGRRCTSDIRKRIERGLCSAL